VIVWFRILSTPIRQFHFNGDALPFLDPKQARHELLIDAGELATTTGADNASVSLTLRNTSAQCTKLFADPPLGADVELYGDEELLFEGTVSQIDLSATDCKISVTA
jgi:hypothetical protein